MLVSEIPQNRRAWVRFVIFLTSALTAPGGRGSESLRRERCKDGLGFVS